MPSTRLHLFCFRNPPLLWEPCHQVNATFQMVKIPDWVKLSTDNPLNFQMDHKGLGYRFRIWKNSLTQGGIWFVMIRMGCMLFMTLYYAEIPYFAQLQPFDLVALDTDLRELRDTQINNVRMSMGWIAQVTDSFTKWWESAPTNKPFPHTMLTHEWRQLIHDDFVKATDFLGTTYRAYEQLIIADPSNRLDHITNWDKALGKVRNCFKCIETCIVSDNYFRSVTGLPPAPYPESQLTQSALERTSPEDLTSCAQLKVDSVNRWCIMMGLLHQTHQNRLHPEDPPPLWPWLQLFVSLRRHHPLWPECRQCRHWICYTNHRVQMNPSLEDQPLWE